MKSVNSRKAYSATKIRDEVKSSCDYKSKNKISCASASYFCSREKIRNSKDYDNLLHDETLKRSKSTHNSNKTLFLNASQILSKLQKICAIHEDSHKSSISKDSHQMHSAKVLRLSFKKLNFYYDLLKRLLKERCVLILEEESRYCIMQTQKLVTDLKHYFCKETIKLITMPVKSYNRFIDSSDISISVLEQLFIKVNSICDLHSSLKNNYQIIINFFHVGFDMELNQMLIKLNRFLNNLFSEMFYWTNKILEIFILRLCLADSDAVSPEFLHHMFEICESFNLILFDKKPNYKCLSDINEDLVNSDMHSDYEVILLQFILQYLSHFEAKVAAEKIIHYLIHECKNYSYSACVECTNKKEDKEIVNSNTSDYYSISTTITDENVHSSSSNNFNFENIFLSFIQRNQSLILKYLYSIICLDVIPVKKRNEAYENLSNSSAASKTWNQPQFGCKSKSYLCLEEKYWMCFWEKVFSFCLKLVLEVPCHQYGNAAAGVFLFWPYSYQNVIFKIMNSFAKNKDISSHGSNVLKKLLHYLLVFSIENSWDKNMSFSLSMMHNQCCMPIPVAENRVRTQTGNALCLCLESLEVDFLNVSFMSSNFNFQVFYAFQVTFDCFIFFTNIKTRSSISSADLSTFLIISLSDCVHAIKLLEKRHFTSILNQFGYLKCFNSLNNWGMCISKQIEVLSGQISDAPFIIHRIIFHVVRNTFICKIKKGYRQILYSNNLFELEMFSINSIRDVLNSFTNVVHHICDKIIILSTVTSATAFSMLSVLQSIRKSVSYRKIQALKEILLHFSKWLEALDIEEYYQEELRRTRCLQKVYFIIHILESSTLKPRCFRRTANKVSPLLTDVSIEERIVLTEEEQLYWRECCRRNYLSWF